MDQTQHIIYDTYSVKDALDALNRLSGGVLQLFVVNEEGVLIGALSDGDMRRALLRGVTLDSRVGEVMNTHFVSINSNEDPTDKIKEGKGKKIRLVPVTREGRIYDILDLDSLRAYLPIDVVMMAGGRGERLRPLTLKTPKPLLTVGDKAIIDRNIEALEEYGVSKIYVTVNYMAEKIEEHFAARNKAGKRARVECVREPKRLGTLGSVAHIETLHQPNVLVMNSDLLTTIEFDKMWEHHVSSGADITVGAVPYSVSVPYAIMRTSGTQVIGLQEKPTFNYFANGGVYLIKRELIEEIAKGEYLDAPDFLLERISKGGRVEYFPIMGQWIDIGSPNDYVAANRLFGTNV